MAAAEVCFFDAYNEVQNLQDMVEHFNGEKVMILAVSWQTSSTGTGRIFDTVRNTASTCSVQCPASLTGTNAETKNWRFGRM